MGDDLESKTGKTLTPSIIMELSQLDASFERRVMSMEVFLSMILINRGRGKIP